MKSYKLWQRSNMLAAVTLVSGSLVFFQNCSGGFESINNAISATSASISDDNGNIPDVVVTPTPTPPIGNIDTGAVNNGGVGGNDGKGLLPYINPALIPAPVAGSSEKRVENVPDDFRRGKSNLGPVQSDIGAFREACEFSHMRFDDPILYPRQPGKSPLNLFFGNTAINANSTTDSIINSGNSTCAGGILNRSGYWMSAIIDTGTGKPVKTTDVNVYYKTGYTGVKPADVRPIPPGLTMLGGSARDNGAPTDPYHVYTLYSCVGPNNLTKWYQSIQEVDCKQGDTLVMEMAFPQCWDGVNLDSPNHRSHMAYSENGCPKTHPVAFPQVNYNVHFPITDVNDLKRWRLSTDNYSTALPGGYSGRAGYISGWDEDIMKTFVNYCENLALDCHNYLLGDDRWLY